MVMKFSSFIVPLIFLAISFILLVLPGNEFPKADIFRIVGLDKFIHTILFGLLTILFCKPFSKSSFDTNKRKKIFFQIALLVLVYGILMEFVQKYFVPFRSFELADILFDGVGATLGHLISRKYFQQQTFHKKVGPDRNRGRNQN